MSSILQSIFTIYSEYTGSGILVVLFFVGLIFIALSEKDRSNKTIFLYGNMIIIALIFFPLTYYLYVRYVDTGTYWRIWWLLPMGICLAYVGTRLIYRHRVNGMLMFFIILLLGGRLVYTGKTNGLVEAAQNPYQIPQEVINIVDVMEYDHRERVEDTEYDYLMAAFPAEFLEFVRQYDVRVRMPYGREMLDPNWGGSAAGFYTAMNADTNCYELLAEKCMYNSVDYIVINGLKSDEDVPEENGFVLISIVEQYRIYRYDG